MHETRLLETLAHFEPDGVQAALAALEQSGQTHRHVCREQTSWEYTGGTFDWLRMPKTTSLPW